MGEEEVTEGDFNDDKPSNLSQDKPSQAAGISSSSREQMDVDASVNDLLSDDKKTWHWKANHGSQFQPVDLNMSKYKLA